MKSYSSDAVTSNNLTALDEKQTRQITELKLYVKILAVTQVLTFGMTLGLFIMAN